MDLNLPVGTLVRLGSVPAVPPLLRGQYAVVETAGWNAIPQRYEYGLTVYPWGSEVPHVTLPQELVTATPSEAGAAWFFLHDQPRTQCAGGLADERLDRAIDAYLTAWLQFTKVASIRLEIVQRGLRELWTAFTPMQAVRFRGYTPEEAARLAGLDDAWNDLVRATELVTLETAQALGL